jgi:predicted nuclease of restriction endonuclease-like (RecB) superfamily
MADKPKKPKQKNSSLEEAQARIPTTPSAPDLPAEYTNLLAELKQRIREERLRVVMTANAAMVLLYWDIGCAILERQQREGWGAKVIDRLSTDLRREFPDMQGLSPCNLKYMRAFAAAWPDRQIVQEVLAQITWYHNIALLDKLDDPEARLWYARKVGDVHRPIGVAEWGTRLVETLPEELKGSLPTVKELEAELQLVEEMEKEHGHGG